MEEVRLIANTRKTIGKQVKALRREGLLPAIVYGTNFEPLPISLNLREASRQLQGLSSSHLFTLEIDGKEHMVLVRDKQYHPVRGTLLHVDFQRVSMTETLRVTVPLVFVGESPAVKQENGVLVAAQEEIEIECLPKDMPERIEVDLSKLEHIGDMIYVRDLVVPANVEVLTPADETVAVITAPESEAVEEGESAAQAEPEVIERGKKEEEEF